MYINLEIFTPLAVKPDFTSNNLWVILTGDLDPKSSK